MITVKPVIRKCAVEFDNGGGTTVQTAKWSHYYATGKQAAADIKAIIEGASPAKDGWDGHDKDVTISGHPACKTVSLKDIIETIKNGQTNASSGFAESEFWSALGVICD